MTETTTFDVAATWREVIAILKGEWQPPHDALLAASRATVQGGDLTALAALVDPEQRFMELSSHLESLPIHTDDIDCRRPMGFILQDDEWWPCSAMNRLGGGAVEYRIDYQDGSTESGFVDLGRWADCNADGNPSVHADMLQHETV